MLPKKQRLPIQRSIGKKAKTFRGKTFSLKIFHPEAEFSRFGVVISSKVSKKATERNRIKRQIFNFCREAAPRLPLADYLVIAAPPAAKLNKEEIEKELNELLKLNP